MAKDAYKEAEQEHLVQQARRAWVRKRIDNIHENVTAYEILQRGGVDLNKSDGEEEQFSCPFHGEDRRPSARVYPTEGGRPSHAWCFVCQEKNWDAIGLWRKFNGEEDKPFTQTLSEIERAYGLKTPELHFEAILEDAPREDPSAEKVRILLQTCENCLRRARPAYRELRDLNGYLTIGSVLDRVYYQWDKRQLEVEKVLAILQKMLGKITEKEICLAG
jgi:hypothetical protein